MSEQTTAASSPADVDVFRGEQPTLGEYNSYRQTGELPARFKPAEHAESAPADTPEQTASEGDEPESAGVSEPPKDNNQEQSTKRDAEWRVSKLQTQLDDELAKDNPDPEKVSKWQNTIEKVLNGKERKAAPAPATQPKDYPPPPPVPQSRPKPTMDDKNADGSLRYADWDTFNDDVIAWNVDQGIARYKHEQAQAARVERLRARNEEARQRFGDDFERLIKPMYSEIRSSPVIHDVLKEVLDQSEALPDLMDRFVKDPQAKDRFYSLAATDAFAAIKYIGVLEDRARQSAPASSRNDKGQFTAKAEIDEPAPEPKRTQAPKPPSPVSGSSSRGFDVSDEGLSADEWMRKRNKQVGKG